MISQPVPNDPELLASFVKTADGAAFATLTGRHLGLVIGVARRRTGSREMAQEAAQNTFCRLARQAGTLLPKMREGVSLAPWLHAVALREAGTLMRAEAVRQRALRRLADSAVTAQSPFSPMPPPPAGSEYLDEALAALPETGRRALILRYLQGLSLSEIASQENTSEEAARKRVTRALDRLTRLLARRGVTAAGVTACLAAAPVLCPQPSSAATLAARAVQQAAAPAAGAGLSGMAGFALSQWPVAAVFLLAAVPAAWPWGMAARPADSGLLRHHGSPDAPVGGNAQTVNGRADISKSMMAALMRDMEESASSPGPPREVSVSVWNRSYRMFFSEAGAGALRLAAANRSVMDFSLEEVRRAVRLAEHSSGKKTLEPALYARWAELMPEEARQAAEASESPYARWGMLTAWARTDLPGAAGWARDHDPDWLKPLLEPLVVSDPAGYLRLMDSLGGKGGPFSKNAQYDAIFPYAPELALKGWRDRELGENPVKHRSPLSDRVGPEKLCPDPVKTLLSFAAGLPEDSGLKADCQRTAAQLMARDEPERAAGMLAAAGTRHQTETQWMEDLEWLLRDWKARDPATAAEWLGARSALDPDVQARLALRAGLPRPAAASPNSIPVTTP